METTKEGAATAQQLQRFHQTIELVKTAHGLVHLEDRDYAFASSGTHEDYVECPLNGDELVFKCVKAFSVLVVEIDCLVQEARAKYYNALLLYGESGGEEVDGGSALTMVAKFLPFLSEMSSFVRRCYDVCRNVVLQLYGFFKLRCGRLCFSSPNPSFSDSLLPKAKDRTMTRVWRSLGNLLATLVVLQEIIEVHPTLKDHWSLYVKSMQTVQYNPAHFDAVDEPIKSLVDTIANIDAQLFTGFVFQNSCQQYFGAEFLSDKRFMERLHSVVSDMLVKWDRIAADDMPDKNRLLSIVALGVFYHRLAPAPDKKLLRSLCATHRRIPSFHLIGDLLWTPADFILQNVEGAQGIVGQKAVAGIQQAKEAMLNQQAEQLQRELQITADSLAEWKTEMADLKQANEGLDEGQHQVLFRKTTVILKGIRIADKIGRLVKCVLSGYLAHNRTLSKTNASVIFRLIETIKVVESTFSFHWPSVLELATHATQYWSGRLLQLLENARSSLSANAKNASVTAALGIAENAMSQAANKHRLIVCGIALEVSSYLKNLRTAEYVEIDELLTRLDSVSNIGVVIERVTDCSFLFWHRPLSDIQFRAVFDEQLSTDRIELSLRALNDCCPLLACVRHCKEKDFVEQFESEIFESFKEFTGLYIADYVTAHLAKTFYNLTAVALHDCETYKKMRLLAKHRYGLVISDSHLPSMKVDQGLDLLAVIRKLNVFVSHYSYDLNEQMFVERNSKSRMLNVMRVQQVVNSIKTHGVGLLNSTVNAAYQLLKKKFQAFSQFLYDEQIRAQLVKDIRFYRDNIDELDQMYPVKRAERFNNAIVKLGTTGDGKSFLDKFRELITQIGNTIGFVRMVSAGAVEASSYAAHFLRPKTAGAATELADTSVDAFERAGAGPETLEAARVLEDALETFSDTFHNTNDYIQMLISVFAKESRNFDKFAHLRNFFIIVPPLTINYVEHITTCRNRIGKRSASETDYTFFDDGFSVGIAYMLTLLNQTYFFDSLNWFKSVFSRFEHEAARTKDEHAGAVRAKDDSYAQTLSIRIGRLEDLSSEFEYVMFTLHSALLFLGVKDTVEETEEIFLEEF
ncbi:hypothetical protein AAVH_05063 [Aphelenchoides avenae]|nr:hypothetical protein AAVH_05063 [Aphelenchus avenae]